VEERKTANVQGNVAENALKSFGADYSKVTMVAAFRKHCYCLLSFEHCLNPVITEMLSVKDVDWQ
jgi:hypothetical protein